MVCNLEPVSSSDVDGPGLPIHTCAGHCNYELNLKCSGLRDVGVGLVEQEGGLQAGEKALTGKFTPRPGSNGAVEVEVDLQEPAWDT